jgi:hypothetical protein
MASLLPGRLSTTLAGRLPEPRRPIKDSWLLTFARRERKMPAMSMKRTKQAGRRSAKEADSEGFGFAKPKAPEEPALVWDEQVAGKPDDQFVPYAISRVFERMNLIQHPSFGKGVVTAVEGKRIVVLFQDGTKKLGHGAS